MTLPNGWAFARVDELAGAGGLVSDGDWVESKDQDPSGEVRLIQLADVGDGDFRNRSERFMTAEAAGRLRCTFLEAGDALIARMPDPIGRACIFPGIDQPAVTAVDVMIWRTDATMADAHWFVRWINSPSIRKAMADGAGGTTRQRIAGGRIKELELPLPPKAEQRRIVAKLDALTARLARVRAELDRVPALADNLRNQILELAQNGSLTADWRLQNESTKSVGHSLDRVRAEREHQGRQGKRVRAVGGLPNLPIGWLSISPDEIAADSRHSIGIGPFGSNLLKGDYRTEGTRLIFVRDIRRQHFGYEGATFVDAQKSQELAPHSVLKGDVLVTKMGDPPGDCALYDGPDGAIITADCIKLRAHPALVDNRFLALAVRFPIVQSQILAVTKGVAQQKISLDTFRRIALPVPSLAEQAVIVARADAAFTRADRLDAEAARARALLDRLESAILAKAFRGELVPQDPNDEPASVLLDRIRAQRAAAPKAKRGRAARASA